MRPQNAERELEELLNELAASPPAPAPPSVTGPPRASEEGDDGNVDGSRQRLLAPKTTPGLSSLGPELYRRYLRLVRDRPRIRPMFAPGRILHIGVLARHCVRRWRAPWLGS